MLLVGHINLEIFRAVSESITTDEVVLTDERIEHIQSHHPNDFEQYVEYLKAIVEHPDYILKANRPNSAVLLKEFSEDNIQFYLVLRLHTPEDPADFKNSVITFLKTHEKEWNRLLNNKIVLYKRV